MSYCLQTVSVRHSLSILRRFFISLRKPIKYDHISFLILFFFFFSFFLFRATPMAYGSSQVRGLIGATAAGCTTATAMWDPSQVCNQHHSSQQCQIPDPLSKARDQTHILMDPRQIHFCCAITGTPLS